MIQAYELRSAYLKNPMGIDVESPRLSWKCKDALRQTAFQIRYARNGEHWQDLPPIHGQEMYIQFPETLHSRDRIQWQVRLTDERSRQGDWSEIGTFEMGLLASDDWRAHWIMGAYQHDPKKDVRYPVDCYRKDFRVEGKVLQARLYITACGMYETKLNGRRVGDQVLTPGSTAFHKRVHYQTYDVTDLLSADNTWEIELADGFYAGSTGVFSKAKTYGYEPKVLAQLEICLENGQTQTICTDSQFRWSNDGPIRLADMKDGEVVDFRCVPSYCGFAQETEYEGILCAANSNPVHEKEHLSVISVLRCPNGQQVLDFGQNIAGYMEVSVAHAIFYKEYYHDKTCRDFYGFYAPSEG